MKIESRQNIDSKVKSTVVLNGKKYLRTQKNIFGSIDSNMLVEWRKCKTNHLVNAKRYKELEESYQEHDNTTLKRGTTDGIFPASATTATALYDYKTNSQANVLSVKQKNEIDNRIKEHLQFGNLLSAVKYYKDVTGIGLKEAKDYVGAVNVIFQADKKWNNGLAETRANQEQEKNALNNMERYFKNSVERSAFIQKKKEYLKTSKSTPKTVKAILDETNWSLYGSKIFFDTFIK